MGSYFLRPILDTEIGMTCYKKTERTIEITRNTSTGTINPISTLPHMCHNAPQSVAEPGPVPARCGQFTVNYIIIELIDMESMPITHETCHNDPEQKQKRRMAQQHRREMSVVTRHWLLLVRKRETHLFEHRIFSHIGCLEFAAIFGSLSCVLII